MVKELICTRCGHRESWEVGDYFGEHEDFRHHICGMPGKYAPCGPKCQHDFPGRLAEESEKEAEK